MTTDNHDDNCRDDCNDCDDDDCGDDCNDCDNDCDDDDCQQSTSATPPVRKHPHNAKRADLDPRSTNKSKSKNTMAASRKRASSAPDVDNPTRKRSKPTSTHGNKDEIQQSKSPAEFFAENQSIAGFDNPGKSLYTTLRELIENSLDACESVDVLPDIHVVIEEMSERQFNRMRGVPDRQPGGAAGEEQGGLKNQSGDGRENDHTAGDAAGKETKTKHSSNATKININTKTNKTNTKSKHGPNHKKDAYFLLTVRDNGCGMAHDAIPDLLGRVLSGSKYGVRQTRGKFGLGAKMALIWSKKSTGVPIRIKTSHVSADARRKYKKSKRGGDSDDEDDEEENDLDDNGDAAVGGRKVGKMISTCVLDIGKIVIAAWLVVTSFY